MELLANYDDGSSTPKAERNGEESNTAITAEYERMMNSLEFDSTHTDNPTPSTVKAPSPETTSPSLPWLSNSKSKGSDGSSSGSQSSSGEDSGSEDEESKAKKDTKRKGSESTDYSSDSSSASGDSKQEKEAVKAAEPEPKPAVEKDSRQGSRPPSTSSHTSHKAPSRRRSRSHSKERRHRRSSDRRRRSTSRSKDRRRRHHRPERKPGHRSGSPSKDRHSRRRSSKDRRRREGHRRKRSGSRDAHRRRRGHPSGHRRHRRSRSPDHKKTRPEKVYRSRSRSPPVKKDGKVEVPGGVRPPGYRTVFGRGRGNPNGFKEQLRQEFIHNCSAIQTAVSANPNMATVVTPLLRSNVATSSAGLGANMGGMTSAILNQMQMAQKMAGQTLPGGLTQQQMVINQRAILQATGRTREQVEAETGVKVPEYYNEVNFNVKEWAEREKKRKTLFKKKAVSEVEVKTNQFSTKAVLPGADQAQAEKFSRLLGVKKHHQKSPEQAPQEVEQEAERQDHLLEDLSKSYDSARVYTHLARGSGLGYSSTMYQPLG
ncbi:arginine/serine-rich coiled-coil protein 2-like isoform X2 [Littorina saxatilis]|uniref:arginine/serine-rich coiled-coil protein 2-like isoform X2 n=1 Tax=Littorina saxatilis TaxID=31220 RepID=UPI0038B436D5